MKKRNIVAFTLVYAVIAVMFIGFAVVTAGDCGIAVDAANRDACFKVAEARRFYGFVIAAICYPLFLWRLAREAKRNNEGC